MTTRIGVFGGTFDPPHLGHVILAAEAHWQLHLTRMLWVLTAQPPHKSAGPIASVNDRLAMLGLELHDEPDFEISRVDIDRPGPHYTLDTLRLLRKAHTDAYLILLLGGDSLHDLPGWHRPSEVLAACDGVGVMRRPNDQVNISNLEAALPGLTEKLSFIDAPLLEISSHEIRERAGAGHPFRHYLASSVYSYIMEHRIYRA